ncbi:hypothetical protein BP00DRAFT_88524 [Aspergillus indologenus CBS 114.80]|uniref:Uncharacterized protein n=1 Tax=Aspergillus indologenus CBS 114.80 TaxID=1450541 RepID=A0A2V5IIE1_9EURO|nr:hypothetical protein BP00DRAFT_88524 [Aspergillus indologenus CBS 114.80]
MHRQDGADPSRHYRSQPTGDRSHAAHWATNRPDAREDPPGPNDHPGGGLMAPTLIGLINHGLRALETVLRVGRRPWLLDKIRLLLSITREVRLGGEIVAVIDYFIQIYSLRVANRHKKALESFIDVA